jgi:hypothetical protein
MPAHGPSPLLYRVLASALNELPIHRQMDALNEVMPVQQRPFLYVGPTGPVPQFGEPIEYDGLAMSWVVQNSRSMATALIRHHGLDSDRISLLHGLGAIDLGPSTYLPVVPVSLRLEFPWSVSDRTRGVGLAEAALATRLLLEFDAVYHSAFRPFITKEGIDPTVELSAGSVKAILSKSAAGLGLLLLLDAASGGATIPFTGPLYAKVALGSVLSGPAGANFLVKLRSEWLGGTKTEAEADEIRARTEALRAKQDAEKKYIESQTRKNDAEAMNAMSAAMKNCVEAAVASGKSGPDLDKMIAETDKVRTETQKLRDDKPAPPPATPPSADVPQRVLTDVAGRHGVSEAVVAMAVNEGMPVLAEAQAEGMHISLDKAAQDVPPEGSSPPSSAAPPARKRA